MVFQLLQLLLLLLCTMTILSDPLEIKNSIISISGLESRIFSSFAKLYGKEKEEKGRRRYSLIFLPLMLCTHAREKKTTGSGSAARRDALHIMLHEEN